MTGGVSDAAAAARADLTRRPASHRTRLAPSLSLPLVPVLSLPFSFSPLINLARFLNLSRSSPFVSLVSPLFLSSLSLSLASLACSSRFLLSLLSHFSLASLVPLLFRFSLSLLSRFALASLSLRSRFFSILSLASLSRFSLTSLPLASRLLEVRDGAAVSLSCFSLDSLLILSCFSLSRVSRASLSRASLSRVSCFSPSLSRYVKELRRCLAEHSHARSHRPPRRARPSPPGEPGVSKGGGGRRANEPAKRIKRERKDTAQRNATQHKTNKTQGGGGEEEEIHVQVDVQGEGVHGEEEE